MESIKQVWTVDSVIEVVHAARRVGVVIEQILDAENDVTSRVAIYLKPDQAVEVGKALVEWGEPRCTNM